MNNDEEDDDNTNKRRRLLVAAVAASFVSSNNKAKKFTSGSRMKRRSNPDYRSIVKKVTNLKVEKPALFTRMFRLSPQAFDKVLEIIQPKLLPKKFTATYYVPPLIKLCLGLTLTCWCIVLRPKFWL